ncbi:MAG: ADP-ribose pyrophosphatase YjhB, NUDIX family [Chloroflexi bacterium]|nr:MAG: ADP-ribose pyrophosphatase YjhB, NUDIX family [Chloroflexota bacterium]
MSEPISTVGAGAVVVRQQRLLLVRQTYGWATGRWLIPNGALHPGETLAQTALRELAEETGLHGTAGALCAVRSLAGPLGSDTFVALNVDAPHGDPRPDHAEVSEARFFDRDAIAALDAEGLIVRLHRLIAEHVLPGPSPQPHIELPALDRDGHPARSTLYLA